MRGAPTPPKMHAVCLVRKKVAKSEMIRSRSVAVLQNKKRLKILSAAKNEAVWRFEVAEDDVSCAFMLAGTVRRLLLLVFKVGKIPLGDEQSICLSARKVQEKCLDYVCLKLREENRWCVSVCARNTFLSLRSKVNEGTKHKLKPNTSDTSGLHRNIDFFKTNSSQDLK